MYYMLFYIIFYHIPISTFQIFSRLYFIIIIYSFTMALINILKQCPLLVCAPMVDQSELAFRLLCRRYGANLCYTPMLHSRMLTTQKKYKEQHFTTCPQDRPLVAQLCGDDPDILLKAAKLLQDEVDAIDLNFGCPQGIARRGHYGSFLLQQSELIESIVRKLSENLKVPLFCKIRILKSQQKTFNLVNKIVNAGCKLLTVHGRTKQQNKQSVGECNWDIIKKIKESVNIPIIANGGIYNYSDIQKCLQYTNAEGVMSAEALLQNPALFSNKIYCLDQLAKEYLQLAQKYNGTSSQIKAHLFKILYKGLSQNTDLRDRLAKASKLYEFKQIANELQQRRKNIPLIQKFGWYFRHQQNKEVKKGMEQENLVKQQNKEVNKGIQQEKLQKQIKV